MYGLGFPYLAMPNLAKHWRTKKVIFWIYRFFEAYRHYGIGSMLSKNRLMVAVCSAPVRSQPKLTRLFRAELEIINIQSEQHQQRDDDLRSPLMSAVHANCLRTVNLLFMAYGARYS